MKITDEFVLFYGGPFSQWYHASFIDENGFEYNCAEKYMMAKKAEMFGDETSKKIIMGSNSPKFQKQMGRSVKNFDKIVWDKRKMNIVGRANFFKFFQNEYLKKQLLDTGEKIIAEASPYDKIWGIGLSEDDPKALNMDEWQGLNLLGQALMGVRALIQGNEGVF